MSNTDSNTGIAGREGSNLITSPLTYFLSKETDKHPLSESDTESDLPLYLESVSETCSYNSSVDIKSQKIGHTFSVDTPETSSPCLEDASNLNFQHSLSNIHLLSDAALTKLIASSSPALIHRIISSYCSDIRRAHTILAEKDIEIKSIREQWSRLNHSTSDSHLNQNIHKHSFNVTIDKQLEVETDTDSGWFLESRSSDYSMETDQPRTSSSSVPSTPFRTPSPLSSSSTWPKHSRSLSLSSPIPSINSHSPVRTSIENPTVDLLQANSKQSQCEDPTENKLNDEVDHSTTNPNGYQPSLAREHNLHTTDDIISVCSSKVEVNPCSMEYMDGREETPTPNYLLPTKLTSSEPRSRPLHFKAIALAIKLLNPDGSAPAKLYINSKRMSTLLSGWTIDLLNGEKTRTPSIINTCSTEEATLCQELSEKSRKSIYLDNFKLNGRTNVSKLPVGIDNPRTKESRCPSSTTNNLAANIKIPSNKTTPLEPKSIPRYSHLSLVKPEILYPIDCHGFYSNTTLLASTGNPTHALYSPPNSPTITPATITVTKDTSQNPSVHQLLAELMDMHDVPQVSQKEKWDAFVERRRAALAKEINGGDGTIVAEQGISLIGMGEAEYKEFKKLVRAGIPAIYRAKVWEECAGAYDRKKVGYYSGLLARHEDRKSIFLNQIELVCFIKIIEILCCFEHSLDVSVLHSHSL
ncbi:hypothetical protein K7432_012040 [Basidiobolus ranarum]|uniref:Rab-GAP TBC domain-containing protein n=1 Tax=Basidiobolus ranarum TaxID=34480 RepID=A0ABR2WLG9_9FUNG